MYTQYQLLVFSQYLWMNFSTAAVSSDILTIIVIVMKYIILDLFLKELLRLEVQ